MHLLTLNGLSVKTDGKSINIYDKFQDISEAEVSQILKYLVSEGFINESTKEVKIKINKFAPKHRSIHKVKK